MKLDNLNPLKSIEQKSKEAIGVFVKTVNDLVTINEESMAKRSVNVVAIVKLQQKQDVIIDKNEALVKIEAENETIINKINNNLN